MRKYDIIDKGIAENNLFILRGAIGSICYINRDFSNGEFDYYIRYVEKKGIKIKEDGLKGKLISEGKSEYTEDDFEDAVFELKENFCDERIADVKKIGMALYGKTKPVSESSNLEKKSGTPPKVQSHQKQEKIGLLVAVAIVVVIVLLIRKVL